MPVCLHFISQSNRETCFLLLLTNWLHMNALTFVLNSSTLPIIPRIKWIFSLPELVDIAVPIHSRVAIPCNVSVPKDDVLVLLWYKNANATGPPIYSLDFRSSEVKHFISEELKDRAKATDSTIPPSLVFENVSHPDEGVYSCRADYKWSRTESRVIRLNIIGKTTS